MNTNNICILGAEIQEVMWKIGTNPWASNFIQPFTAGDTATAILKVTLEDCAGFEGKTLEAFVQVPNDANDIVKIFALIDANNQALFTLPKELLWWPGDYNVNFMFADGDKVNYSNVLNASYTVNENPALAGQNPPTILPGDKAEYEDLISKLSQQTNKADQQIPLLTNENNKAETNIQTLTSKNSEANQLITDLTNKISEGDSEVLRVQNTGTVEINKVTAEGTNQVVLVKTQGNTSLAAVQKVKTDVEAIIQGDPAGGNAIALGGKTRAEFDDEIQENKEQIQNCVQSLDDSLVAYIGSQGISSNVAGSNVINTGGNVIEGTGVSFVKTENGFGIGEGYENLCSEYDYDTGSLYCTISDRKGYEGYTYTVANNISWFYIPADLSDTKVQVDSHIFVSFELDKDINLTGMNIYRAVSFEKKELNDGWFKYEYIGKKKQTYSLGVFGTGDSLVTGEVIKVRKMYVTNTSNKVPFVPHSFRGGEMKINKAWTTETHSFLRVGLTKAIGTSTRVHATDLKATLNNECFQIPSSSLEDNKQYDAIVTKSYSKFLDGDTELGGSLILQGQSGGLINLRGYGDYTSPDFGEYLVFKGQKTKEEMLSYRDIIKSGNYKLSPNMQGTVLPIEGMVRRADKYGIVEMSIEVTDNSRDLWYSKDDGIYEVMDNNLNVTRIKSKDINSTSSPIRDVSGRGRLNAAITLPAYVRKVK